MNWVFVYFYHKMEFRKGEKSSVIAVTRTTKATYFVLGIWKFQRGQGSIKTKVSPQNYKPTSIETPRNL